jgi:hypothetical protein
MRPSLGYKTQKPARQFMYPFLLTLLDGFLRHQLSTNADGTRSRKNKIRGCQLIYASRRNQGHVSKRSLQRFNVFVAAD